MIKSEYSIKEFVSHLELLIQRSARLSEMEHEIHRLENQVKSLKNALQDSLDLKSIELCRELETEVLVRLAKKLLPLFGMTAPENFESVVRNFLDNRADVQNL